MDIIIDLERSEYVKQRANLLKTLETPTISDTICTLGEYLAQVIFDQCDEALKVKFGLVPPLDGAGDTLWTSPSDLLIGKVALKPPYTEKHIQALTHQGILSIGMDIEKKYWNEMELEKEKALINQRRHLLAEFEETMAAELKNIEIRERAACQMEIERINQEFQVTLLKELLQLEDRLRNEYENMMKNREKLIYKDWDKKLQEELQKTIEIMTKQFLEELEQQESILVAHFKLQLQKAQIQKEYDISVRQAKCRKLINQLRHNLECRNISNLMYLLCMERRKCGDEKIAVEEFYMKKLNKLNDVISEKDKQIKKITEERNKHLKDVNLRETCLLGIIKQYQKFINFALRAAPTQAEFLLSVEKLMTFELADSILKVDLPRIIPCEDVLSWQPVEKFITSTESLEIKDHHNCFNEITPPKPEGAALGPDDFLPAFHYKEKLYVREDFRNMISQGIQISPSNELWSKDVEILMDVLRQSVSSSTVRKEVPEERPDNIDSRRVSKRSIKSNIMSSTIKFKVNEKEKQKRRKISLEEESIAYGLKKGSTEHRSSLKPMVTSLQAIDFAEIGTFEKEPTLLATRNSLELILQKGSVRYIGTDPGYIEEHEDTDRSIEISEAQPDIYEDKIKEKSLEESANGSITVIKTKSDQIDTFSLALEYKDGTESKSSQRLQVLNSDDVSKVSEKTPVSDSLVTDTRDSIILRKTSLLRKSAEFKVTPEDSIQLQQERESKFELKKNPSKLATAKNSLEILRESLMKCREPIPKFKKKEAYKMKAQASCNKSQKEICDHCFKGKNSIEVFNDIVHESKDEKDIQDRSVRLSGIEIINVEDTDATNVAFDVMPIIYERESASNLEKVSKIYAGRQKHKMLGAKKTVKPPKDRFLTQPKQLKIVGDSEAKQHLQNVNEFTIDRIHSFVSLIKDDPNLIRTFTSCTR